MNREKLISYSFYCGGEYDKIYEAIKQNKDVKDIYIENALTILDEEYPKKLLDLKYPPFVLYYKGNLNLLKQEAISIVGSRIACDYALKATKALVLNNLDKVVISGLAKGIDTCGHENALKTIGVLGCGIDYIYPSSNYKLINDICKNGLVISEYPKLVKPLAYHFPFRNRIIVGLSEKVYVMQSNLKSGTMTSVNEALELGKEVKVLPYDIFSEYGVNNNHLIYEGASIIEQEEIAFLK